MVERNEERQESFENIISESQSKVDSNEGPIPRS